MEDLNSEEKIIIEAIKSARTVQKFLWGKHNQKWGLEEWRRMFRKRVTKIDEIDIKNPHWKVEMKKRLLQTASLSIALIYLLDDGEISLETNLPQYKKKKK